MFFLPVTFLGYLSRRTWFMISKQEEWHHHKKKMKSKTKPPQLPTTHTLIRENQITTAIKMKQTFSMKAWETHRAGGYSWFFQIQSRLFVIVCHTMNCSAPGSSVHRISQARILEWVVMPFSRGFSLPQNLVWVSCITGRFFIIWVIWVTREILLMLHQAYVSYLKKVTLSSLILLINWICKLSPLCLVSFISILFLPLLFHQDTILLFKISFFISSISYFLSM